MDLSNCHYISCWVVPDGGSFTYSYEKDGVRMDVLVCQWVDLGDFLPETIPGRVYVNEQIMEIGSAEETEQITLLKSFIPAIKKSGHPESINVVIAKRVIDFFESGMYLSVHEKLNT